MSEQAICFLTPHIPPFYAGAGKRALNQASYLANKGYKIVFISVIDNAEQIPNSEMVAVKLPAAYEDNSLAGAICRNTYHPVLFYKMFKIIAEKKIKLLHCIPAFSWPTFSAVIAAKLLGVKIVTETTLEGSDDPLAIINSKVGKLKYIVFKLSDAIVNISPLLLAKSREAGIEEEKLHLIPNAVNADQFMPPTAEEKQELRHRFGLNTYRHIFIYVGVMRPRKGVSELIQAYKMAQKEINGSCLVLAGPINKDKENIDYYNELKKQVEKEDLVDKVMFTGEVSNIEQWLKAGDVFLFASKREGLPNVVLEAMSAGLPVIAMRIPQTMDYIFDGIKENGIIADDIEGFSKAMIELVNNKDLYQKISVQARKRVKEAFNYEVVMDQYIQLYRKLLE